MATAISSSVTTRDLPVVQSGVVYVPAPFVGSTYVVKAAPAPKKK